MKHLGADGFQKIIILSDLHGPFLDKRCWKIVLDVIADFAPSTVILNGDVADFSQISKHDRKIRFIGGEYDVPWGLYEEIMMIRGEILGPLRKAAGKAKIIFRKGNHEQRWDDIVATNPGALQEMLVTARRLRSFEIPDILQFEKYGITYDPKPYMRLYDMFTIMHGTRTSRNAAMQNLQQFGSGTSGHTHKMTIATASSFGQPSWWIESGCLRRTDNVEYAAWGTKTEWLNGFLSLYINKNKFFCTPHVIIGRQCNFQGKIYSA